MKISKLLKYIAPKWRYIAVDSSGHISLFVSEPVITSTGHWVATDISVGQLSMLVSVTWDMNSNIIRL